MTGVGVATQHGRSHFDRDRLVLQNGRKSSTGNESTVRANVSFFEKLNDNNGSAIEKRILHFNSSGFHETTKKAKKEKDEKLKAVVNGDCTKQRCRDIVVDNGETLDNLISEHVKLENGIHEIDFEEEKKDQVIKVENILERHGSIKIRIGKPKICINGDSGKEFNGTEKGLSSPPNISSIFLSKSNSDLISPSPSPYLQSNKTNGNHNGTDTVAKAISKLEADIKAKNTKKKINTNKFEMADREAINTVVTLNNHGSFRIKETIQNGGQKDSEKKNDAKGVTKKSKTLPIKNPKTKMTVNGKPGVVSAVNVKQGGTATSSPVVNGKTGTTPAATPKTKPKPKVPATPSKNLNGHSEQKPVVSKTSVSKQKQDQATPSKALKRPPILLKPVSDKTAKETQKSPADKVKDKMASSEKTKEVTKSTAKASLEKAKEWNKPAPEKTKKTDNPVLPKSAAKTNKSLSSSTGAKNTPEKKTFGLANGTKNKTESVKHTEKNERTKTTSPNGVDKKSPVASTLKSKPSLNGKVNGLKTTSNKAEKQAVKTKAPAYNNSNTKNDKLKIAAPTPTREKSLLSFERKKDDSMKKVALENSLNKSADTELVPAFEPAETIPTNPEITSVESTSVLVETTVDVKDIVKKLENGEIHDDVEIKEEEKAKEEEKETDLLVCKQNKSLETILTSENEKSVASIVSDILSNDVMKDDIINNHVVNREDDIIADQSPDDTNSNTDNNGVQSFVEKIKNEYNKKNLEGEDYKYISRISPVPAPPPAPEEEMSGDDDDDEEEKSNPYARNVPSKEFLEFLEDYKINEGNTIVERNETVYETGKYISPSLIRPVQSSLIKNNESANTTYSHKIKMADMKKKKDADNKYEQSKEDILSTDLRENGIEYNDDTNINGLITGLKSEDHAKTDFSNWYDKTYGHYAS